MAYDRSLFCKRMLERVVGNKMRIDQGFREGWPPKKMRPEQITAALVVRDCLPERITGQEGDRRIPDIRLRSCLVDLGDPKGIAGIQA